MICGEEYGLRCFTFILFLFIIFSAADKSYFIVFSATDKSYFIVFVAADGFYFISQ